MECSKGTGVGEFSGPDGWGTQGLGQDHWEGGRMGEWWRGGGGRGRRGGGGEGVEGEWGAGGKDGVEGKVVKYVRTDMGKKSSTLLDLCVSSLRRGHANLLCIVPILTDVPRKESK